MIEEPAQDTGYETLNHRLDFLALVRAGMVPKKKWYLS